MTPGQYPRAKRYERSYPQSVCNPHRIQFSDGYSYVVKFQGNPIGNQILVNELVASGIADLAGFSVAHGSLVTVDAEFIGLSPQLTGLKASLQFGSRVVADNACFYGPFFLNSLSNREELAQIIVLDTLVCNADRHDENLLLVAQSASPLSWKFFMIDHSHCFATNVAGSAGFAQITAGSHLYENAVPAYIACNDEATLDLALLAIESISEAEIGVVCDGIPDEWGLLAAQREALKSALVNRRNRLREIIKGSA